MKTQLQGARRRSVFLAMTSTCEEDLGPVFFIRCGAYLAHDERMDIRRHQPRSRFVRSWTGVHHWIEWLAAPLACCCRRRARTVTVGDEEDPEDPSDTRWLDPDPDTDTEPDAEPPSSPASSLDLNFADLDKLEVLADVYMKNAVVFPSSTTGLKNTSESVTIPM